MVEDIAKKNVIEVTVKGEAKTGKTALVALLASELNEAGISYEINDPDGINHVADRIAKLPDVLSAIKDKTFVVIKQEQVRL